MRRQLQLILAACIVNFGLTSIQSQNHLTDQFQNLFDSIAKNNAEKSEIYSDILKQEVAKEQYAFNAMEEELEIVKNKNAYRKRNFYEKRDTGENVKATKRATNERRRGPVFLEPYKRRLEESFLKYHPDPHKIIWRKAGNLTAEEHRVSCLAILSAIAERSVNYHWMGVPTSEIQTRRVIHDAPLQFQNETVEVPLVKCFYEEFQFYITRGDDDHVYNVYYDIFSKKFHLKSGPFEIYYKIDE